MLVFSSFGNLVLELYSWASQKEYHAFSMTISITTCEVMSTICGGAISQVAISFSLAYRSGTSFCSGRSTTPVTISAQAGTYLPVKWGSQPKDCLIYCATHAHLSSKFALFVFIRQNTQLIFVTKPAYKNKSH